jgi:hypothetical protein
VLVGSPLRGGDLLRHGAVLEGAPLCGVLYSAHLRGVLRSGGAALRRLSDADHAALLVFPASCNFVVA